MKLEVGKTYKLNNGDVVTCSGLTYSSKGNPLWVDEYGYGPFLLDGVLYHQDGRFADCGPNHTLSVSHEVVEENKMKPEDINREEPYRTWEELSPEEKGLLLLAQHEGKQIEYTHPFGAWIDTARTLGSARGYYRVKQEPVVATLFLDREFGNYQAMEEDGFEDTHKITFNLVDGEPDCSSIKMEKLGG